MNENELILTSLLGCRRIDLYTERPRLSPEQKNRFDEIRERRGQQEPLQYLLGEAEFYGLSFQVDPRVLIPRPETELLVEAVVQAAEGFDKGALRILEFGTGSGNIAVSLAKSLSGSRITSLDVSAEALALARDNVARHACQDRVFLRHQDLRECLKGQTADGIYDVLVSNPPYVPREDWGILPADVRREPRLALDGGPAGMGLLLEIISKAPGVLVPGGILGLEFGDGQRAAVAASLSAAAFEDVRFLKDFSQTDRIVIARRNK